MCCCLIIFTKAILSLTERWSSIRHIALEFGAKSLFENLPQGLCLGSRTTSVLVYLHTHQRIYLRIQLVNDRFLSIIIWDIGLTIEWLIKIMCKMGKVGLDVAFQIVSYFYKIHCEIHIMWCLELYRKLL